MQTALEPEELILPEAKKEAPANFANQNHAPAFVVMAVLATFACGGYTLARSANHRPRLIRKNPCSDANS
jgi:hypothetical protein